MVVGSNLCLFRGPWWCSAWSWVRIFVFLGVNGWCSAWPWVRIFVFLGVNGGVVHGRGLWPWHVLGPIQTFRARIANDKYFVHEHCEISISIMQNTFSFLLYLRLHSGSFRSVPGYSKITSTPSPLPNTSRPWRDLENRNSLRSGADY
jgi:hypothetical protein